MTKTAEQIEKRMIDPMRSAEMLKESLEENLTRGEFAFCEGNFQEGYEYGIKRALQSLEVFFPEVAETIKEK